MATVVHQGPKSLLGANVGRGLGAALGGYVGSEMRADQEEEMRKALIDAQVEADLKRQEREMGLKKKERDEQIREAQEAMKVAMTLQGHNLKDITIAQANKKVQQLSPTPVAVAEIGAKSAMDTTTLREFSITSRQGAELDHDWNVLQQKIQASKDSAERENIYNKGIAQMSHDFNVSEDKLKSRLKIRQIGAQAKADIEVNKQKTQNDPIAKVEAALVDAKVKNIRANTRALLDELNTKQKLRDGIRDGFLATNGVTKADYARQSGGIQANIDAFAMMETNAGQLTREAIANKFPSVVDADEGTTQYTDNLRISATALYNDSVKQLMENGVYDKSPSDVLDIVARYMQYHSAETQVERDGKMIPYRNPSTLSPKQRDILTKQIYAELTGNTLGTIPPEVIRNFANLISPEGGTISLTDEEAYKMTEGIMAADGNRINLDQLKGLAFVATHDQDGNRIAVSNREAAYTLYNVQEYKDKWMMAMERYRNVQRVKKAGIPFDAFTGADAEAPVLDREKTKLRTVIDNLRARTPNLTADDIKNLFRTNTQLSSYASMPWVFPYIDEQYGAN